MGVLYVCRLVDEKIELPEYDYDGEHIFTKDYSYNISLIYDLSSLIHDYVNYPTVRELLNHLDIDESDGLELIYALEHNVFDKYLKDYAKQNHILYFNNDVSEYLISYFNEYVYNEKEYNIIAIEWSRIQDINGVLPFTMIDIMNVLDGLEYYSKLKLSEWELIKETGNENISRLLFNLYNHVFDKWIYMYLSDDYIFHKHKRKVYNPLFRMKYIIHKLDGEHFVYANGKKSSYTVSDIVKLKKELGNFNDYPSNYSLGKLIDSTVKSTYNRIIWNVEEGVYDKWINHYMNKDSIPSIDDDVVVDYFDKMLSNVVPYNIFECTNENVGNRGLHFYRPYEYYFKYYDRNGDVRLSVFSKSDVEKLKNACDNRELLHLQDYCGLVPHIGVDTVKRVLASIVRGRFDKFI